MKFLEYFTIITFALMCGSCIVRASQEYDRENRLRFIYDEISNERFRPKDDNIYQRTNRSGERTPEEIREEVKEKARGKVKDLNTFLAVMSCESQYFTKMFHVNNNGSVDRGYFQINDKAHPDISDECAFNFDCALEFTIKLFNGRPGAYVCYAKNLYKKHLNI